MLTIEDFDFRLILTPFISIDVTPSLHRTFPILS
jgi:hypothetical protein